MSDQSRKRIESPKSFRPSASAERSVQRAAFTHRVNRWRLRGLLVSCLLAVFASIWLGERPAQMDSRPAGISKQPSAPRRSAVNPANKIHSDIQAFSHSMVPLTPAPFFATAVYDSVLKAPKCASAGSVCDSGTLLNGRDTMSGGAEPNQPNTIKSSCADGSSGTYHGDESLDAIKVSTVDSSNLATGKTVKIEVTVWAYSSYTADFLDLYYAADASNPNWVYLTTKFPSIAGSQVLSTTYPLPNGATTQAVRGHFRFTGDFPSSCGGSTYDDYDDLIFTVQPSTLRTLTVASSNPGSGVGITVTPNDVNAAGNGTTQFTRVYNLNQSVNLTAPATAGVNTFQKWLKDGADFSSNQTISVAMDNDHTMTAVYQTPGKTLTVASTNPASGVNVTVSPVDRNSGGDGSTQFTRLYDINTSVTLTAGETAGNNPFQKWLKDGADFSGNQTKSTSVTMDADHTMTAVYVTATDGCEANISIQGSVPRDIAVNSVTNKIYVASQNGSFVDVINGADNSTTTVPVGTAPVGVAVNSATNKIYVANYSSNNVTVINGANNSAATVPAGNSPVVVAINQTTNKIYVVNSSSNNVTAINGADNTTATVAVGAQPTAVAVNSTTNKIYVTNYDSGNVTVINGADNTTATVPVGSLPRAVAVNSTTNKIYVVNSSGSVTVINGTNNSTSTVFVGSSPSSIAINAATNKIFVTNSSGTDVTVINGADNSTSSISGFRPTGVAVNAATNRIYVGSPDTNSVKVFSGADNSMLATIPTGLSPTMMAVNATTNKIYVPSGGQRLVTVINGNSNTNTCSPTTASVSGRITNGNGDGISGGTVTLTNVSNFTTYSSTGSGSNYTINNVPIGINYSASVSPFGGAQYGQPTSVLQPLTGNVSGLNFAKTSPNYTAAGNVVINGGGDLSGLVVTPIAPNSPFSPIPCPTPYTGGNFSCNALWVDTVYDIVPTKPGYTFTPDPPIRVSNFIFTLQYTGNPLATVATSAATSLTQTTAVLNGTVNPNGITTNAGFEWGTDPTLTTLTPTVTQSKTGTSSQAFAYSLPGLTAGTTYYFRAAASNAAGVVRGSILSFTTTPPAPSNLTYSSNPAVYTKGLAITPNLPSNGGGAVASYSINPVLPAGLNFNTTTGAISGTPTVLSPATNYTVTATNSSGSTTASVNIKVNDVAPSNLTYSTNPAAYTKGVAITFNTPTSGGGAVVSYSINPALPSGLNFNTTTGVISGTPTVVSATASYTVTATNTGGSTTVNLSITVKDVAPSALTYSTSPAVYTKGVAVTPNTPTSSGGTVVSYSINPALPSGLNFNTATGVISGTPSVASASANYTVTATNSGGSTTVNLNITVNDAPPPGPMIFIEEGTGQLAAVDSVTFIRGPFTLNDPHNFNGDQRTRILFFTTDLGFTAAAQPPVQTLAVIIEGISYPVESVGPVSGVPGLVASYIVFRLPDLAPGDHALSIRFGNVSSTNSPTFTIIGSTSSAWRSFLSTWVSWRRS